MADIRTIALPVADLEYNSNDEAQTRLRCGARRGEHAFGVHRGGFWVKP